MCAAQVLGDSEYMASVLGSLPGVDPNDPSLRGTIEDLAKKGEDKKGGPSKKEDGK